MIGYLAGTVLSKQQRTLVVSTNGVGYFVYAPRTVIEKSLVGDSIALYIHTHVREDDISLFGMLTEQEWNFFKMLLTVSGVGPKSALEIMNAPLPRVRTAIIQKDLEYLTKIQGIGKKTAERICVDLQGKLEESAIIDSLTTTVSTAHGEIIEALISLGFTRQQVINGLKQIPQEVSGDEAIIKYFLKNR